MRRLILCAALALAGCGDAAPKPGKQAGGAQAPVDDGKADCITGEAGQWAHDCLVERQGDQLTIRHPDGGFRRFRVLADGRGLEAADGAEPAKLRISGTQQIEVTAGDDRYRLPARIAGQ
ncbi:hypothetical protein [Sphingobium sp. CAP-1]|uniref:hypothetical protein n=1 Tax=Sphingobium sp. CAP-1 TaxID=2676077 RepID=UPI0012BB4858|nr:hypothetical protein [Sphingobium sp. CAP-1]QGP78479.1 hypothetical protein GL174_05385 [Sphingobium sp. CAP-1]